MTLSVGSSEKQMSNYHDLIFFQIYNNNFITKMLTVSLLHKKDLSRSKRGEMWKATPQWLRRLLVSLLAPCWNVPVFLSILFFGRNDNLQSSEGTYTFKLHTVQRRENSFIPSVSDWFSFQLRLWWPGEKNSVTFPEIVRDSEWRSRKLFVILSHWLQLCPTSDHFFSKKRSTTKQNT